MEKKTKIFIGKIKSVNEEDFTVDAVVSDETIDRYGEVILADAYKKRLGNYKKHGILLSSHNYGSLLKQIGMAENIKITNNELHCKFKYFFGEGNEEADWAWKLASKYKIAAYSVGFLPYASEEADWEKDGEAIRAKKKPCRKYTDVELLEISQVLVPANPMALQKSLEEFPENISETDKEIIKEYSNEILKSLESDNENINKDLEDDLITKPDTDKYIHLANPGEEGKHTGHKIRTISISKKEGISAHYCVDDKVITGYIFDKKKWTHEEAEKWVKEHSKYFEEIVTKSNFEITIIEDILLKLYDEFIDKIEITINKQINNLILNIKELQVNNNIEKIDNNSNSIINIESKQIQEYIDNLFKQDEEKLKEIFPIQS